MSVIGNYQLGEELGKGPLGTVYVATHIVTNKQVVFRGFMQPPNADAAAWAECIQRYSEELSHAVELNHPNIAQIFEYGHEEGIYWLASEMFSGQNISRLLDRQVTMTAEDASAIVEQVGAALEYAFSKGLIHCDLTPFNILVLEEGTVKVINFGLGHIRSKWGSPYAAPEVVRNETPDSCTDVFSLGVIIYEMLTGDAPWIGSDPDAIMAAILSVDPDPPAQQPKHIQDVVMKMLAKEPQERYATAGEAAKAFCGVIVPAAQEELGHHDKKKGLHGYHVKPGLSKFDLTTSDVRSAIDDLRSKITSRQH